MDPNGNGGSDQGNLVTSSTDSYVYTFENTYGGTLTGWTVSGNAVPIGYSGALDNGASWTTNFTRFTDSPSPSTLYRFGAAGLGLTYTGAETSAGTISMALNTVVGQTYIFQFAYG